MHWKFMRTFKIHVYLYANNMEISNLIFGSKSSVLSMRGWHVFAFIIIICYLMIKCML